MKISAVSNLLIRSFFVFIIAWLWISFYVSGFFTVLLISSAITLGINYAISFFYKRRNLTKTKTKQEREHIKQITLQLKAMPKAKTLALLIKALPPNAKEYVTQKKFIIASLFHVASPSAHDIISCIKNAPQDSKTIVTAEYFPPATIAFARSLDARLVLLDAEAVYTQILAPTQTFPELKIQLKKTTPRKTLSEIKQLVFGRHRTKSYMLTGAIILLSSLIIRLHIYYIIAATIVFVLALTSHFSRSAPKNLFDY